MMRPELKHKGGTLETTRWARWRVFRWNCLLKLQEKISLMPADHDRTRAMKLRMARLQSLR